MTPICRDAMTVPEVGTITMPGDGMERGLLEAQAQQIDGV